MTRGEFELTRVVRNFCRVVRDPPDHRWLGPLVTAGAWLLRRSGMRPCAPKRNVLLGLIYLYALLVLVSVGSV
jgi:hypothetical protein